MSTGTSKMNEIEESIKLFKNSKLYLMHCVSMYPCNYSNANIPKMKKLMRIHDSVGYSDHIQGSESAKIAIAEGALVIEKHFTLNNDLPGRDNKFAILPNLFNSISKFRDSFTKMNIDKGLNLQECEKDIFNNYRGRWSK